MLKILTPVLLVTCFATSAFARPLDKEAGFGLTLGLYGGTRVVESQFNTQKDNQQTDTLDSTGESLQTPTFFPLGRIQYTFDDLQTQVYFGNSKDQVATASFQYELGFIHQFENKTKFTIAYFPELSMFNETWEDPFLTGKDRVETRETTTGGRIALERIFGSPFSLKYAYATNEVENENSGLGLGLNPEDMDSLKRDSKFQRVEAEVVLPIANKTYLRPTLKYTVRDSEGEANSYNEYAGLLSVIATQGKHTIISTLSLSAKSFDKVNPIFNRKQDSNTMGFFTVYSYNQPFDWESISFTLLAGFSKEDSDIDFYDVMSSSVVAGVTYTY